MCRPAPAMACVGGRDPRPRRHGWRSQPPRFAPVVALATGGRARARERAGVGGIERAGHPDTPVLAGWRCRGPRTGAGGAPVPAAVARRPAHRAMAPGWSSRSRSGGQGEPRGRARQGMPVFRSADLGVALGRPRGRQLPLAAGGGGAAGRGRPARQAPCRRAVPQPARARSQHGECTDPAWIRIGSRVALL